MTLRVKEIYLDVDDVLNDLTMYMMGEFGYPMTHAEWLAGHGPTHDFVGAYNHFSGKSLTADEFWPMFKRHHWAKTPKSEIFDMVMERSVDLVGRSNIYVLTAPTKDPDCAAGKMEWVHEFLPSWIHRKVMIGACKHIAAQPERLLIDDAERNIDPWYSAGGIGLLVPRPWNRCRDKDTYTFVENAFNVMVAA